MRTKPTRPGTQPLRVTLDATKLPAIDAAERCRALTLFAKLLLEAADVAITERPVERG
ncbi:hypothetical protein [Methylobacterium sp. WL7]|uniref:hypothetical protein n=1 Tax=Methylobacterium sp. WL7 TaxID=2603900 RepID=UPI00164F4CE4|nr:hypothetical protein [Methylobacterium sp. WL7]